MWRRVVAACAVVGAIIVGLTVASASQLNVTTRNFAGLSDHICSLDTVTVTGAGHVSGNSWSQVRFQNIPAACDGLPLGYVLYQPSGAILRQGTTTAATGTVTVNASSAYDHTQVEGARILLATWPGNATWVAPVVPTRPIFLCYLVNPGNIVQGTFDCNPQFQPNGGPPWDYWNGPGDMWNYTFAVTGPASLNNNWYWIVDIDHSQMPYGATFFPISAGTYSNPSPGWTMPPASVYQCNQMPILRLRSNASGSTTLWMNVTVTESTNPASTIFCPGS